MEKKIILLVSTIGYLLFAPSLFSQVRNDNEALLPAEGVIQEATWGTYLLENSAANRRIRLGVSNDGYTRAEIFLENNNTSHGRIYFKTINTHTPAAIRMTIQSNGNVGIGTTNPTDKLAVNGNIRAKEIKVETANWPDYVFQDGYEGMSLPEIELFIRQNGHLPEMPSASEVEKEGISLGKMNKLLLKKIEELTLLLIEKNREIEYQGKEITEMKDSIKQVENWIEKND
ncbi:hypothetical protein FAZ15_21975 [Sphingobacterium olei]|uniref:Uncharacterized protein n=1 Tax=Sphingobacterium olei TaxID=2571155 RepID=A0A4U0NJ28_9SPHI|nr:hypothetical protein [Sphingobacterium olei]TJZ49894.1 hypothetical protein FAZ15_21975 [Sphingobacterium olei]